MADAPPKYVIYADGACLGNPGPGGWGAVIAEPAIEHRELNGGPYPNSTNNRMEITAVIEGLRAIPPGVEVTVRSDSEYVVKTMSLGWKRNTNQEFWNALDQEVAARRVRFEWVRGHSGDQNNERADKLATSAAKGIKLEPISDAVEAERAMGDLEKLESLLEVGELVRRCARCGQSFVTATDPSDFAYCSLVPCQLKARTRK